MRKASMLVTSSVASAGFVVLTSLPAFADDAAEIAASIESGGAYVEGNLANQGDLNSTFSGTDVGIVVVTPVTISSSASGQAFANDVAASSGTLSTVVVVVKDGSTQVFVSTDGGVEAANAMISEINTNLRSNNSDITTAINESREVLVKPVTATSTGDGSASPDDGGLGVVGIGGIGVGLALATTACVLAYRRFFGATTSDPTDITYDKIPEDLRKELQAFRVLVMKHSTANNQALSTRLQSILGNVQELFRRIDRKGTESQKRMAAIEYTDTLAKLNKALGEDYYLDIVAHPNLWDDAQRRMVEVRDATIATDTQIVQNIRQVNASQDLDFQVALESLTRSMNTVNASDMMNPNTKDDLR